MLEIAVLNQQRRVSLSSKKLGRWARKMLRLLGKKHVKMSLVLMNDAGIRKLHRKYLKKDHATDVLAFARRGTRVPFESGAPFLGEVVVSVETARRQAPQFGNPWDVETLLYVCHGVLHLMGYRDSSPAQKARMERRQERVLSKMLGRKWQSKKRKPLF